MLVAPGLEAVLAARIYRAADEFAVVADADVVVLCVPTAYHRDHLATRDRRLGTLTAVLHLDPVPVTRL